jgi:glycosyltransferase involved in cell wall biosynthesis
VPSHYEPFGLVAIEAMACRTPVIASQVGGLQFSVVPEVTGLLVPPQDEAAFAQAIDRVLSNPTWAEELGQTGRQRVEIALSWDSVASRLGNLYNQLLSQDVPVSTKTSTGSSVTLLKSDVVKIKGSVA